MQSLQARIAQNEQGLLRALAVVAVLLASALIAQRPSGLYLVVCLGLGVVLAIMRWPPLGLMGIIIGALVIPIGIGTGSDSELNPPLILLIVLLGLWLLDMVRRREIRLTPSRTIMPLLVFVVVALLSFCAGQLPWFHTSAAPMRAQIGGLAIFVLSVGAFLLMCHLVKDLRWLERLTWLFLALGAVYMAGWMFPQIDSVISKLYTSGAVGSLFWTWLVALAFSQAAFNRRLHPFWRVALGVLVLTTLYIGMARNLGWTSGWAPALVAVIVILIAGSPRRGLSVVFVGAAVAIFLPQVITGVVDAGDNAYSILTRGEAWRIVFEIIKVSPILGLGPANYYWYTPLFSILGYHVTFNSHNNYVDLVAQTGVLGLACFLWFSWEVGRLGWRLRSRAPEGFGRAYVYGALGGLAGTLVAGMLGDWVLPFVYNIGLAGFRASVMGWLFLGGLVVLQRISPTDSQAADRPSNVTRFVQPVQL